MVDPLGRHYRRKISQVSKISHLVSSHILDNFSQYKETCEVLLDCPKIGGENIKYFVKKAIRNILHENIDVHSIILIA